MPSCRRRRQQTRRTCVSQPALESEEGCAAQPLTGLEEPWAFGWEPWTPPALEDLLPDLSLEEQLRLQGHLRRHERIVKDCPSFRSLRSEEERDFDLITQVRHALRHYNITHPDDEFDVVKPLMEASVCFKKQVWIHINFWVRNRKSNKIKRFFAEVRYKPPTIRSVCSDTPIAVLEAEAHDKPPTSSSSGPQFPAPIPIVEVCTIIKEPLNQYRRSCAFCGSNRDILHPVGSRKFVCGNDKDRFVQQLKLCKERRIPIPFTGRPGPASPNSPEEETE